MQLEPLNDRVVLITGASRGLGKAMALAFARHQAHLILCAQDIAALDETASEARHLGVRVTARAANVAEAAEAQSVVDAGLSDYGRIDALINNAAIASPNVLTEELTEADWDRAMQVNLRGPFLMARAVIPIMRQQQSGRIVNVSSALSVLREPYFGAYTVSKAGLNALTRILAAELAGSGVLVNGLDPGAFRSRMNPEVPCGPDTAVSDALFLASLWPDGPSGRFFRGGIDLGW